MSQNLPLDAGAASQQPPIRLFQLDAGAFGDLADAVNRFRGDLNLPLKLVELPGRNGLDVVVSAFYGSNVSRDALTWNATAPTSVLGLGWQMSCARIFVDGKQAGNVLDGNYFLQYGGGVRPLVRIGEDDEELAFQSRDFPLWKIRYHRGAERWSVVRENGLTDVYGDAGAAGGGTLMYGVKWRNWIGASKSTTTAPSRFVMGWNLARSLSPWGDRITYRYLNDEPEVVAGLRYTRSSDVLEIEDVEGRKVRFVYAPKEPFEVVAPHQTPDGEPDPLYQDRYDTNALKAIEVHAAGERGAALYEITFAYRFADIAGAGDDGFKKRLLTSVTQSRRGTPELPPVVFSYSESAAAPNPGALETLIYPEGGVVTVEYKEKVLNRGDDDPAQRAAVLATDVFDKNITVPSPDPSKRYQPLVWQGFDYLVIGWYTEDEAARLDLEVFQFGGRWSEPWKMSQSIKGRIDLENVQVALGEDFFGLYLPAQLAGDPPAVRLFQKRQDQFGQWREHDLGTDVESQSSIPAETSFSVGDRLLVLRVGGHRLIHRWSFDPVSRQWEHAEHGRDTTRMSVAARGNHYVAAYYDDAKQRATGQLFFRDGANAWSQSGDEDLGQFEWQPIYGRRLWSLGATFAAATYQPAAGDAVLRTLWWDESFRVIGNLPLQGVHAGLATVAVGSVLANGGALHRFDGSTWKSSSFSGDSQTRYAYGDDLALISRIAGGGADTTLARYDPNLGKWTSELLPRDSTREALERAELATDLVQVFPPTVSGRYFTAEDRLYLLLPDATFEELPNKLPVASTKLSLENRAPGYLVYEDQTQNPGDRTTFAWLLDNGEVVDTAAFPGERIYTEGDPVVSPGYLAGHRAFVTYPADRDVEAVDKLFLHRLLNHSFTDRQTDPVVAKLTRDLGSEILETRFEFDGDTAVYDFSGEVVQYPRVREENGTAADPTAAGFISWEFYNGLAGQVEAPDLLEHYSLLSGLLRRKAEGDAAGALLTATENEWRAVDLLHGEESPVGVLLAATKIQEKSVRNVFGGLEGGKLVKQTDFAYDPATGLRISSTLASPDASGAVQVLRQETLYAWRVPEYAGMKKARMLAQVAQETLGNSTSGVSVESTATTWRDSWPSASQRVWAEHESWRWRGESPTAGTFAFGAAGHPGWLRQSRTDDRGPYGQPLRTTDVDDVVTSFVYDRSGRYQVAKLVNADATADEAGYVGFESYESLAPWTLADGAPIPETLMDPAQSHAGLQSLRLPGQGTSSALRARFEMPAAKQRAVFSCWVRTRAGFPQGGRAAWTLELAPAGGGTPTVTELPVPDTRGAWSYLFRYLDLTAVGAPEVALTTTLRNGSGQDLWLDDVRVAPLEGDLEVWLYQRDTFLPSGALDVRTAVTRQLYDALERPVAVLGAEGQPLQVTARFFSREGERERYAPDDPNSELTVAPAEGGALQDLRDGDWQRYWRSPDPSHWVGVDDGIEHRGTSCDTLTLVEPAVEADYGVRLEVPARTRVDQPLGLEVGDCLTVQWVPAGKWQMLDGARREVASFPEQEFRYGSWLLIAGEHGVMFFRDGRLVLDHWFDAPVTGDLRLFTGTDGILFRQILVFRAPRAEMAYLDGGGDTIQQQTLSEAGTVVSASLYDAARRRSVTTKARPYAATCFGYQSAFITGFDPSGGVMTGELADYYDGSDGRSDDEGFPYWRSLYAASGFERLLATGQPGRTLAVTGGGHATRETYATNTTSTFPGGLPAASYALTVTTDPQGNRSEVLRDMTGRAVASQRFAAGGDEPMVQVTYGYDPHGRLDRVFPPNFHQPPAGEKGEGYVVRIVNDGLGRAIRVEDPDSHETEMIYDDAGRLRFVLPADGRSRDPFTVPSRVRYQGYDRLGRLLEAGEAETRWNDELRIAARDPAWLPPGAEWKKRIHYDGDGEEPWALGRPTLAKARLAGGQTSVQRLTYDVDGNPRRIEERVVGEDGFAGITEQRYNAAGELVGIDYPRPESEGKDAGERLRLTRAYTKRGQLRSIGLDGRASDEIAAFTYGPQGELETEVLDPRSPSPILTRFAYNSPVWPQRIESGVFSEQISYWEEAGYGGQTLYDGSPSRIAYRFHGQPGMVDDTWLYAYDGMSRLQSAASQRRPEASMGTGDRPLTFDANSNLLDFGRGPDGSLVRTYEYYRQTDRLRNADGPGTDAYGYDADGDVTSTPRAEHRTLEYDFVTGLTERVRGDAQAETMIAYDGADRRIRTLSTAAGERRYFWGAADGGPLVEQRRGTTSESLAYVYGPAGLIALNADDGTRGFRVRDHLGSSRLLLDASGNLLGGWDYGPFGEAVGTEAGSRPGLLSYRYTGQEWDAQTGLYNYRARLYDPAIQRFLSPDPAGEYFSPYVYVGGNPLVATDPSGEFASRTWAQVASAVEIGAALGLGAAALAGAFPLLVISVPLLGAGATGFSYSRRVDESDFRWGQWGQVEGAGSLSAIEIGAGIGLLGLILLGEAPQKTLPVATTLFAAGTASFFYTISAGDSFNWKHYGTSQLFGALIGFAAGAITLAGTAALTGFGGAFAISGIAAAFLGGWSGSASDASSDDSVSAASRFTGSSGRDPRPGTTQLVGPLLFETVGQVVSRTIFKL